MDSSMIDETNVCEIRVNANTDECAAHDLRMVAWRLLSPKLDGDIWLTRFYRAGKYLFADEFDTARQAVKEFYQLNKRLFNRDTGDLTVNIEFITKYDEEIKHHA